MAPSPRRSLLAALAGDAEVENLLGDEAHIQAILTFEQGLADAEATAGLISPTAAAAVGAAVAHFTPDWANLAAGMARDGVVVPALLDQLRGQIGPEHRAALHLGATSQDAIDTALMLQLAGVIDVFEARLAALDAALEALVQRSGTKPLMAHTRMQRALPFTVADKVRTWAEPLARHRQALEAMRRGLLVIQLGGPVGDRASFMDKGDEIARHLATRLDLGLAEPWHSSRDPLGAFGALLSLISGTLGKFGSDVTLMAQSEVHDIALAGGGGSSAMAHKSNPVKAEVLVSLARWNAGLLGTLHQAMVHENERSGAAWTLEWLTLPHMLIATGASLRIAVDLVADISFAA